MNVREQLSFVNKSSLLIAVLVIFYTVGIVGLLLPSSRDSFLALSFFNLMLSFSIVLVARKSRFFPFLLFTIVCILYGYLAELIGTKTGYLFGNYSYGASLGYKINGVPLVIGVNWALLIVASSSLVANLKTNLFIKSVLAALLMTLLDVLIEPVAIESDFWHWTDGSIPLYNYVSWFFVALPLIYAYFKLNLVESNKVFNALFTLLILFFTLLLIF